MGQHAAQIVSLSRTVNRLSWRVAHSYNRRRSTKVPVRLAKQRREYVCAMHGLELRVRMSTGIEDPLSSIGNFLRAWFGHEFASSALSGLTAPCNRRKHCVMTVRLNPTTSARRSALGMKLRSNFLAFCWRSRISTVPPMRRSP